MCVKCDQASLLAAWVVEATYRKALSLGLTMKHVSKALQQAADADAELTDGALALRADMTRPVTARAPWKPEELAQLRADARKVQLPETLFDDVVPEMAPKKAESTAKVGEYAREYIARREANNAQGAITYPSAEMIKDLLSWGLASIADDVARHFDTKK
jgi:hypothetical protein